MLSLGGEKLRPNKRLHLTPLSRPRDRGYFDSRFQLQSFLDLTAAQVKRRTVGRARTRSQSCISAIREGGMREVIAPCPIAVTSWQPHATIWNVALACRTCKRISDATREAWLWHATRRALSCARSTIALQPTPLRVDEIVRILKADFGSMVIPLENAARLNSTVRRLINQWC
jgi:hypothetical protein